MTTATSALVGLFARAFASGFTGGVLWFIIGRSFQLNGKPAIQLAPWPFGQWWLWVGVGFLVGLILETIRVVRSRRRGQELQSLCEQLGFKYLESVPQADWQKWQPLARFTDTYAVSHGMLGEVAGIPFEIYDHRRRINQGKSSTWSEETVVLFDVSDVQLPTFELQPRTIAMRILAAAGIGEISVRNEPDDSSDELASSTQSSATDDAYDAFETAYHLSLGPRERMRSLVGESEATDDDVARVRRLFDQRLVEFLSQRPQWHLESCEGKLACWRPRQIVTPQERPRFLAEAMAVRAALVDVANSPDSHSPEGSIPNNSLALAGAPNVATPTRMAGTVIGAFFGFGIGGFVGATLAMTLASTLDKAAPDRGGTTFLVVIAVFFGSAFVGLISGAVLGNKLISRFLTLLRGVPPAVPGEGASAEWMTPPPGSSARVERLGDEVRVNFPPLGFFRGSGCFLSIWAGLWNLFVIVSTPLFMSAALRGDVKNEAGQPQSPLMVALFLVPFWLVGSGSLVAIIYQARRRTSLAVSPTQLRVERTTLFGRTEYEWSNEEIEAIETSTTDSGGSRVVIRPFDHVPVMLLGERTHFERRWLSQLLKATLRPPNRSHSSSAG